VRGSSPTPLPISGRGWDGEGSGGEGKERGGMGRRGKREERRGGEGREIITRIGHMLTWQP